MATVLLHYWAGAKAAAGVEEEAVEADSVAEALRVVSRAHADPRFDRVLAACTLLVDGLAAREGDLTRTLTKSVRVEVLPPFAGGAAT